MLAKPTGPILLKRKSSACRTVFVPSARATAAAPPSPTALYERLSLCSALFLSSAAASASMPASPMEFCSHMRREHPHRSYTVPEGLEQDPP